MSTTDKLNSHSLVSASSTMCGSAAEQADAQGVYLVECYSADGKLRWKDVAENVVTTQGQEFPARHDTRRLLLYRRLGVKPVHCRHRGCHRDVCRADRDRGAQLGASDTPGNSVDGSLRLAPKRPPLSHVRSSVRPRNRRHGDEGSSTSATQRPAVPCCCPRARSVRPGPCSAATRSA
jgi:hypothetical protein